MTLVVKKRELQDFHERWYQKAQEYNSDELADYFDKFFSLFVIYNRIYNVVVAILNEQGELDTLRRAGKIVEQPGDGKSATVCIAYFLRNDLNQIINDNNEAIGTFKFILEEKLFNIDLDYGQPQPQKDKKLLNGLNSTDSLTKVEALLKILYKIRCNVFHAEKGYNEDQKLILEPCNNCLDYLVRLLITKIV